MDDGEEGTCRTDILAEFDDGPYINIEVKLLGDENYGKTINTAQRIEHHFKKKENQGSAEVMHFLLLPEQKREDLVEVISESNNVEIWKEKLKIMEWKDVSRSLRRTLYDLGEHDDQWIASAYLFTSMIEQRICKFLPKSTLPEIENPADVDLRTEQLIQSYQLATQPDYLDQFLDEVNSHE